MKFVSGAPRRREPNPTPPARGTGRALVGCCLVTVCACTFPWTRIAFERLWGVTGVGPRALDTSVGFTCMLTCALTAMLVAFEGPSSQTREATRTACAVMMGAAGMAIMLRLLRGAGMLRGVSATHTGWFYAALLAVLAGLTIGWLRYRLRTGTGAR